MVQVDALETIKGKFIIKFKRKTVFYEQTNYTLKSVRFISTNILHRVKTLQFYLEVLSSEELHTHDGEDEPEDKTHQQHVEDGRDGLHQRVHHNLPHIQMLVTLLLSDLTRLALVAFNQ